MSLENVIKSCQSNGSLDIKDVVSMLFLISQEREANQVKGRTI